MRGLRTILAAVRRRHGAARANRDRGATMIEMVVGMIIMTIAGTIFVGGIVTLYRTTNRAQAITASAEQNNRAYQRLERTVRYAVAISVPGRSTGTNATGDWYVELRDTTTGSERCTQLRLNASTKQLVSRTWSASNISTLTGWTPVASDLTNGGAASGSGNEPFVPDGYIDANGVLQRSRAVFQHQALIFTLVATSGPSGQETASRSTFTLTALNSTLPPPTGAICQQAGRP